MTPEEKAELLKRCQKYFVEHIAIPHLETTKNIQLADFKINPLLDKYLARYYAGKVDEKSLAYSLVYPRLLGTSITTSFGGKMQKFCGEVLEGYGSKIPGIDIEFKDSVDGRYKYWQVKSGPETINKDDITSIVGHFNGIKNLARTNFVKDLQMNDICVGVLYGTDNQLNAHYKKLANDHHIPVFVGKDFWHRLTGEAEFYLNLSKAFEDAVVTLNMDGKLQEACERVMKEILKRESPDSAEIETDIS